MFRRPGSSLSDLQQGVFSTDPSFVLSIRQEAKPLADQLVLLFGFSPLSFPILLRSSGLEAPAQNFVNRIFVKVFEWVLALEASLRPRAGFRRAGIGDGKARLRIFFLSQETKELFPIERGPIVDRRVALCSPHKQSTPAMKRRQAQRIPSAA